MEIETNNIVKFTKDISFVDVSKNEEEHLISGLVYEPNVLDTQNEFADAGAIKEAAFDFMENQPVFKINHENTISDIRILESFIAPADYKLNGNIVRKGSWIITVRILDESVWQAVKSGELTGFSMLGSANVETVKFKKSEEFNMENLIEMLLQFGVEFRPEMEKKNISPEIIKEFAGYLEGITEFKDDLPEDLEKNIAGIISMLSDRLDHFENEKILKGARRFTSFDGVFEEAASREERRVQRVEKGLGRGEKFPSLDGLFGFDEDDDEQ